MKTQAFISVFKVRIDKLKESIKEELNKTRSERRRDALKSWIGDIKRLQKVINEAKNKSEYLIFIFFQKFFQNLKNLFYHF